MERYRCYQDGIDQAWVTRKLRSVKKDDTQVIDIRVYDVAERPVAELEGLAVRLLPLDKYLYILVQVHIAHVGELRRRAPQTIIRGAMDDERVFGGRRDTGAADAAAIGGGAAAPAPRRRVRPCRAGAAVAGGCGVEACGDEPGGDGLANLIPQKHCPGGGGGGGVLWWKKAIFAGSVRLLIKHAMRATTNSTPVADR